MPTLIQLKQAATELGLSTSGTKIQLYNRINYYLDKIDRQKKRQVVSQKRKIRKQTKKRKTI